MDIKESKEVLAAVELLAVTGVKIAKGGIGVDDIQPALNLLSNLNVFSDAIKGVKEIPAEFKDIDEKEAIELGICAYRMIMNILAANKPVV